MHSSSKTVTKTDKSSQNSDWGRVRDTFLDGKCLSVEEFQSCLWYYTVLRTVSKMVLKDFYGGKYLLRNLTILKQINISD